MPASSKMLKNKEQKKNRELGIGDATGRLPAKIKKEETQLKCTICFNEIRATNKNVEAGMHAKSVHPAFTFQHCFPGAAEPAADGAGDSKASGGKIDVDKIRAEAAERKSLAEGGAVKGKDAPKKKKKEDLAFLDGAL